MTPDMLVLTCISMTARLDRLVREAIDAAVMTGRELAAAAGVHFVTVTRWRKGSRVTPASALALARAIRRRAEAMLRRADALERQARKEGGDNE